MWSLLETSFPCTIMAKSITMNCIDRTAKKCLICFVLSSNISMKMAFSPFHLNFGFYWMTHRQFLNLFSSILWIRSSPIQSRKPKQIARFTGTFGVQGWGGKGNMKTLILSLWLGLLCPYSSYCWTCWKLELGKYTFLECN